MMYSFEKPTIVTDATEYTNCIGRNSSEEYGTRSWNMFDVFPEKIMGEVQDFNYVYYNPWDPQFVTYMTVDYDGADYEKEMKRLGAISTEEYLGYYSVTGEPEGYDLVAMDSDDYSGFCYAMIPEEGGSSITYVGIVFCNYFLDLDINEHMPAKYLLPGFDATSGNPYERKMMKILMYNPVYRPKIKQSFLISWHKIRKKTNEICILLDLCVDGREAEEISTFFCTAINKREDSNITFSFEKKNENVRVILKGAEETVMEIMNAYYA